MSLPQATPALGPETLRSVQSLAATTSATAQNTILPLQPSTESVDTQRTTSIHSSDDASIDETHRSVVWGVSATSASERLVPPLSSIPASSASSTSSASQLASPTVVSESLSATIMTSSAAHVVMIEPSSIVSDGSEQSVAASTISTSQQTPSFAPVTSQIAPITPNATVYGTYNPSDYCEHGSGIELSYSVSQLAATYRRQHRHLKLSRYGRSNRG